MGPRTSNRLFPPPQVWKQKVMEHRQHPEKHQSPRIARVQPFKRDNAHQHLPKNMSHDWDVFLPASIEPVDWLDDLRDDAQVYNLSQSAVQTTLCLARVAHQARGNEASAGANGQHCMEPRLHNEVQIQVPPPATLCEGWCLKRWHEAEARHAGTLGRSLLNAPNVSSSVPVNTGNSAGLHSLTSIVNNSRTVLCASTEKESPHSEGTIVHWPTSIVAADADSNDPSPSYTANGDITALANTTMLKARHLLASTVFPQFPRPCGSVLVNSTASRWSSIVPAIGITTVHQQQPANAGLQPWAAMQALKKSSAGSTPDVSAETLHAATAEAGIPPAAKGAKKSKHMRCRNCGTRNTPQWRCGPDGPHTLCNACGMRHKKGLPLVDRLLMKVGTRQRALHRLTQEAMDTSRMISGIDYDTATQPRKAAIW